MLVNFSGFQCCKQPFFGEYDIKIVSIVRNNCFAIVTIITKNKERSLRTRLHL